MKALTLILTSLLFSTISHAQSFNSTDSTVLNFKKYLSKSVRYVAVARENGVQGTLALTFKINADKRIQDIELLCHLSAEQDSEVVKKVGNYNKAVALPEAKYTIVLRFFIQGDDEKNNQPEPIDSSKYNNFLFNIDIIGYETVQKKTIMY